MAAKILDGKKIADDIKKSLKDEISALKNRGCIPGLTVVMIGANPASQIYVNMKNKAASELGINSATVNLPEDTSQSKLLGLIAALNEDRGIHGILVQLPLPPQIDEQVIITAIDPAKDVDGFHPVNRGKLVIGEETFVPCTPLGIQKLLIHSQIETSGKHVVIVGRSRIVGLPLATMLVQKNQGANSTVTVCHTGTSNLLHFTKQADILIAAMGKAEIITGDMIKDGVVVIDVGVNRIEDRSSDKGYRIVGDVEFDSVRKKASAITPVPGGVGPMTITMLIYNTVTSAKHFMRASSSTG